VWRFCHFSKAAPLYTRKISRKGAKAQSAAAFLNGLSLRLCAFAREISLRHDRCELRGGVRYL